MGQHTLNKNTWFSTTFTWLLSIWHIEHRYIMYNITTNYTKFLLLHYFKVNISLYLQDPETDINIITYNLQ